MQSPVYSYDVVKLAARHAANEYSQFSSTVMPTLAMKAPDTTTGKTRRNTVAVCQSATGNVLSKSRPLQEMPGYLHH
eukprot:474761-Amphidinium_carterae.1